MARRSVRVAQLAAPALAALLGACGGGASSSSSLPPGPSATPLSKIKHVVIIVQENRSFNDLFYGFPGAYTVGYGRDPKGAQRSRCSRSGCKRRGISITARIRFSRRATAPAVSRHGLPHERLHQRVRRLRPRRLSAVSDRTSAVRVRAARRDEAVFRHGEAVRAGRSDVRVELRREQFHLASVHHRRPSEFGRELPRRRVGLRRRQERSHRHRDAAAYALRQLHSDLLR